MAPKTQGGIINEYVDLFAGSGGWDLAAQRMGLEGTGLELNSDACKTRKAAGFATYEGDLRHRMSYHMNEQGLIASPPCQSFSMAGNGKGREEMDKILDTIRSWSWAPKEPFADPNTGLILEPLRWIMNRAACNRNFRWIAMEQVVPCLPIWQAYATLLEEIGYFTAVGIVNAEQHGVPQTRRRAVLMAHLDRNVFLPKPTHSRYYPRNPSKLDEGVKKWVSMAEALGWGQDIESVRTSYGRPKDDPQNGTHLIDPAERPAHTVTGKVGAWQMLSNYNTGGVSGQKGVRSDDEPAPTITSHINRNKIWFHERPATTVNCDPRISQPGHHDPNESGSQQRDAIRVTPEEAGVLQSFPRDFPWQGTRTSQYQQVGNAIPPLMAQAVLESLIDI